MQLQSSSVPRICRFCGIGFTVTPTDVRRRPAAYCSMRCVYRHRTATATAITRQRLDDSGAPDACWEWSGTRSGTTGYGMAQWEGKTIYAHRLSWEFHCGPIPSGLFVLHHCDNPPCWNPAHLFLGTPHDNTTDAVRKGRLARGERHGSRTHPERLVRGERHHQAKLTETDVREIRGQAATGMTQTAIAAHFGVHRSTVSDILTGKWWRNVT